MAVDTGKLSDSHGRLAADLGATVSAVMVATGYQLDSTKRWPLR